MVIENSFSYMFVFLQMNYSIVHDNDVGEARALMLWGPFPPSYLMIQFLAVLLKTTLIYYLYIQLPTYHL
jgi:hypothetical protein